MFFLKSVRRRLVTGLTIATGLMLIIAAVAILGLIWHQQAVSELEYVLHESPDPVQLSRSFDHIFTAVDVDPVKMADRREQYVRAVREANDELNIFLIRIEGMQRLR